MRPPELPPLPAHPVTPCLTPRLCPFGLFIHDVHRVDREANSVFLNDGGTFLKDHVPGEVRGCCCPTPPPPHPTPEGKGRFLLSYKFI